MSQMKQGVDRRDFLRLMGASMALAGLTGCGFLRRPEDHIVPYSQIPEHVIPGKPLFYASTFRMNDHVLGVMVESHDGRPTKIEGSAVHPYSFGATDLFAQASVLDLYDPDRTTAPVGMRVPGTWAGFQTYVDEISKSWEETSGAGVAFLTNGGHSPLFENLKKAFGAKYPKARWFDDTPIHNRNALRGAALAFGREAHTHPDFSKADVVLSLDCDFLGLEPNNVRSSILFAKRRQVRSPDDKMNRLYVVESGYSTTGAMADHRIAARSGDVLAIALGLCAELGERWKFSLDWERARLARTEAGRMPALPVIEKRIRLIAADLAAARDHRALVVCGRGQPPLVHALTHAINEALGSVGHTVRYTKAHERSAGNIVELAGEMKDGAIRTLFILGGNPAYDAPADLNFAGLLKNVPETIHLGTHRDETAELCKWHLPQSHDLESWGDERAYDGTVSLIQPLIYPLYPSKSAVELMAFLLKHPVQDSRILLQELWQTTSPGSAPPAPQVPASPTPAGSAPPAPQVPASPTPAGWRKAVHDGVIGATAYPEISPRVHSEAINKELVGLPMMNREELEIVFTPDARVYDGRFANNAWLQECPDPITKITWDNPALISPATAKSLGLENEDEIDLTFRGRTVRCAAWIVPGHADGSVSVSLGCGRRAGGQIGTGAGSASPTPAGFDFYSLRPADALEIGAGVRVERRGKKYPLARTQSHDFMEDRPIVRHATFDAYKKDPHFPRKAVRHPPLVSLFEERKYDEGNQWAMVIDLNVCSGCNACVVACQAENNIPAVGKEHIRNSREMHWLRLDRYIETDGDDVKMLTQPLPCQHCENAPCEQVCPVAATTHSTEGLNDIIYNRCIGTRYCENNCPYKVRRFNFYNWTGADDLIQRGWLKDKVQKTIYKDPGGVTKMAHNPNVTVRSRGVMEKCTFCVQRIQEAKIAAKAEGRETVDDGAVVPACAQACPLKAITFGNQNDPASQVATLRKLDRGYELLAELNVKPRVTYLAKLTNPHPEWSTTGMSSSPERGGMPRLTEGAA